MKYFVKKHKSTLSTHLDKHRISHSYTKYFKQYLLILFLISISFIVYPQHPGGGFDKRNANMPKDGTLSGYIKEAGTSVPVEYANIALYSLRDSSIVDGTIADESGKFHLDKLPYGRYYVEINFIGYTKKRINQIFISPRKKDIDIGTIYIQQYAQQIDEVEITAERTYVEYKIDKKVVNVGQDIIAAGGTAVDALENTPSVQTDVDGNVTLRGSSSFRVLIDGRPTVLDGSDALQQIPVSQIENIEIITNPSAKYDPDGIAGIINIVMKKQKESGTSGIVNITAGNQDSYKGDILINYRKGKLNVFAGGDYRDNNRPGIQISNRETYFDTVTYFLNQNGETNRNMNGYNIKSGIEYSINDYNFISISGNIGLWGMERKSYSKFDEFSSYSTQNHSYYVTDNNFDINHKYYSIDSYYQKKFKQKGHEISATANYTINDGDYINYIDEYYTTDNWNIEDILANKQKTDETNESIKTYIKTDYTRPIGENGKFESGIQTRYYNGISDYNFNNYDYDISNWNKIDSLYNGIEFNRTIHSIYSTFSNSYKGIEFLLGIRGEYTDRVITSLVDNSTYKVNRIDYFPTLHISKPISKTQQLQASYSRRIRRPREWYLDPFINYSDPRNIRQGNPSLLPEYTDSYELNYKKRIKSSFISIEIYYRQTNNKINRIQTLQQNNVMLHTFANLDKDYAIGTELMFNIAIYKWWNINNSYNFFNYHIDGEILNEEVAQETNTWSTRFNSTFKLKYGTRLQINGFYKAPTITSQGESKGYFLTSVALKKDIMKRKLSFSLQFRDIFRTMNHTNTSYGENFMNYYERKPATTTITFSISYKINNYNPKRQRQNTEIDFGGGEM